MAKHIVHTINRTHFNIKNETMYSNYKLKITCHSLKHIVQLVHIYILYNTKGQTLCRISCLRLDIMSFLIIL